MEDRKVYYLDLLERAVWTFLQGFAAFWIITGEVDGETLTAALVAGGLSVAKAIVARTIGSPNSAATLSSPPDHAAPDHIPPDHEVE